MSGVSPIKRKAYYWGYSVSEGDSLLNAKRQKEAEEGEEEVESSSEGDDLLNFKRQKDAEEGEIGVESSSEESAPQEEGNLEELEEEECAEFHEEEDEEEESRKIAEDEREDVSFSESTLNVAIGQMSIPSDRLELYKRLINNFGEIVSPNLPKYKLGLTNTALTDLLNVVWEIIETTPKVVSKEKVLEWEDMVSFYSGMGLKVNWLVVRVKRYNDWLVRRSKVDVNRMEGKVIAKRKALEAKRNEVSTLENELHDLCAELETERNAQAHFNFSFFDK
ncbi:hypothetical protein ACHQM5_008843 [Ranunculus cassubicifolius]